MAATVNPLKLDHATGATAELVPGTDFVQPQLVLPDPAAYALMGGL